MYIYAQLDMHSYTHIVLVYIHCLPKHFSAFGTVWKGFCFTPTGLGPPAKIYTHRGPSAPCSLHKSPTQMVNSISCSCCGLAKLDTYHESTARQIVFYFLWSAQCLNPREKPYRFFVCKYLTCSLFLYNLG